MAHDSQFTNEPFGRFQFTEACAMARFVVDVIIRLISVLIPLALGLTTAGLLSHRPEPHLASAGVAVLLGLIIWRTYRLVNGFLFSVLAAETRYSPDPEFGPFHLFVRTTLSRSFREALDQTISTLDPELRRKRFDALGPAHLGTPPWLIYGGLAFYAGVSIWLAFLGPDGFLSGRNPTPPTTPAPTSACAPRVPGPADTSVGTSGVPRETDRSAKTRTTRTSAR